MCEILLDPYDIRPMVRSWNSVLGPPNGIIGPRRLVDHEFVLITNTSGYFIYDEVRHDLKRGDLILVRPGVKHSFHWGAKGTGHTYIHFDFDPAQRNPQLELRIAGAKPFPTVMNLPYDSEPVKLMNRIAEETQGQPPWHRLIWRAGVLELLALLCMGPLRPGPGEEQEGMETSDSFRVRQALQTLDQRLGDSQLRSQDLADAASLSEPHFRRLCRKITGRSPIEHIQQRRLSHARQLLLDPTLRVSQIARQCGYEDSRYFSRLFRAAEGLSPQEYRASVLSGLER